MQAFAFRPLVKAVFAPRLKKLQRIHFHEAVAAQYGLLQSLLKKAKHTRYGRKYGFNNASRYELFARHVPLTTYAELKPYILEMRRGSKDVLWPGRVRWYAQSSGTASARSKYIPVPDEMLWKGHYRGGKDMFLLYWENAGRSSLAEGKVLKLGGSIRYDAATGSYTGDLSGVMIKRLPALAEWRSTPPKKVALLPSYEEKMQWIIRHAREEDVRAWVGIPSWFQILINGLREHYGISSVREIWPQLEVFFHGGIHFDPYRQNFEQFIGGDMRYMEVYNASEGFFGLQWDMTRRDLWLMLDHMTFYEFIPMDSFDGTRSRTVIPLEDVRPGVNYAVVISNASGLWRYIIGDTVRFTSVKPYTFVITGRTKHFINLVGEEVVVENAEQALREAARKHDALIKDYTVGPVFMTDKEKAAHEWIIEFIRPPADLETFARDLDEALRRLNSDYDTKRHNDISLQAPFIRQAPEGLFERWLKRHGKWGGQHKVPRLSQTRRILDELHELMNTA